MIYLNKNKIKLYNNMQMSIFGDAFIRHLYRPVCKPQKNMDRKLISTGSFFENEIGYSRAVVDGNWIFVSGTTGFDYSTMKISEDIVSQAEQCLKNIAFAFK
jgi:enamine deaminase RidA (YjgF/YER057c/UK114 family)